MAALYKESNKLLCFSVSQKMPFSPQAGAVFLRGCLQSAQVLGFSLSEVPWGDDIPFSLPSSTDANPRRNRTKGPAGEVSSP